MRGESVEIGVECLHIHFKVRDGLRAVYQYDCARIMRHADHIRGGVDCAEDVAHVRKRDQLGAAGKKRGVSVEVK